VEEALNDKLVEETQKFEGGSLIMWGCMWDGVGYACKIDGRMDTELYCKILEEDLQASFRYYKKPIKKVVFQQDGDSKHTSGLATAWFKHHGIKPMDWPAYFPDLNPIEHLWWYLKKKLGEYEDPLSRILELWKRMKREWNEIEASVC